MGFKIGVVGAGAFSQCFVPLFQAHPLVEEVAVADLVPERRNKFAKAFNLKRTFSSLEEICRSDMDALAIFTQRHLHGAQVLAALHAGKHVYSAVPMASSIEEISSIIEEVKRSGLMYMSGETSYYYPSAVFCREQFQRGEFGDFVYGEAQYLHDMSHGFYDAFKHSGGADWKKAAGIPPMFYPTHSVSMISSVTKCHAKKVACLGYVDQNEDGIFKEGANLWNNVFSNETAMIRMSDGSTARINEFRRVGWGGGNSVYMSLFGTKGSYEEHADSSVWSSLKWGETTDLTGDLRCKDEYVNIDEHGLHKALVHDFHSLYAKVHHVGRLPDTFAGQPNGHFGSHQFLADDFIKSLHTRKLPPNHAWNSARYVIPGLVAHESAIRDGEWLDVPDLGEPPAYWELLDPESFKVT